jgi:hypothetical protein
LPIGWSQLNSNTDANSLVGIFFGGIIGWLLTALAASLGAPFWFDTLNKVMVIRSTVKPHEKSQEEASEDRQAPVNKVQGATPDTTTPVVTAPVVAFPAIQPAVAAAPAISQGQQPSVADDDTEVDGCDVEATDKTNDEDLPPTQGGVV